MSVVPAQLISTLEDVPPELGPQEERSPQLIKPGVVWIKEGKRLPADSDAVGTTLILLNGGTGFQAQLDNLTHTSTISDFCQGKTASISGY